MATFKCKMCGGQLEVQEGQSVCTCEFCGTAQTVPHFDNEKKATFFKRAHDLRFKCEFDKAAGVYETIVTEYPNEAEAYWGLVLCKYGIEYVDDPKTKKKIPTCHRTQFASIFDDHDYLSAIRCADAVARELYKREANAISKLQNAILEISSKEDPFDVFICYKETDDRGGRTPDSVLAQDIFDELSSAGYKVFFARRTLERKLGSEYEPYIFAALHSAKVMVHVTSSKANSEAVWVRNEWSRYLSLIAEGQKKTLIPCYKGISAYELPDEMKNLQGQDMSKLGAMQDLIYGIKKILKPTGRVVEKVTEDTSISSDTGYDALVRKGHTYLKNHKMEQAKRCFEKAIEATELCGDAYLGMLLCEYQLESLEELLAQSDLAILTSENFNLAREFANKSCNETLNKVEEAINRNEKLERYNHAEVSLESGKYDEAIEQFKELGDFENAEEMVFECIYQKGQMYFGYINTIKDLGYCDDASNCFNEVIKYKNSKEMIDRIKSLKAKIVEEYKASCISRFEIELPKEVTLITLEELVKKVKANRDRTFTPSFEEFDEARDNVEASVIKFFIEKTPTLIQSFATLDECSKLRSLFSSVEKDNSLKAVYPLIKQRESEIKEQIRAKNKKRRKKGFIITAITCGVLAVAVASFFGIKAIVDENNRKAVYASAETAMEDGNYDDAIAYYESLGNYQESQKKIKVCNGLKQLENSIQTKSEQDAIDGIKTIVSAGEKVDVTYETENNVNIRRLAGGNSGNKTETIDNVDFTLYQPNWTGYTFLHWNSSSLSYKNERTYLGMMSNWSLNTYSITYVLDGGTNNSNNPSEFTIESQEIILKDPSKTGYHFMGWYDSNDFSHKITSIAAGSHSDVVLYALWEIDIYDIVFNNWDGSELLRTTCEYGGTASYTLDNPTRPATQQYTYTFSGWDKNLGPIIGDTVFTAQYNHVTNKYTVTFKNWDGSVLGTSTVDYGTAASYSGTPTRPISDDDLTAYSFSGWDKQITSITEDCERIAQYTSIPRYLATFVNEGVTLQSSRFNKGTTPVYSGAAPTKTATQQYTYTFSGWSPSLTGITKDTTYIAQFTNTTNKYTVTFKNWDGTVLGSSTVNYGSTASYSGATPTRTDNNYIYTFDGWDISLTNVTSNRVATAQYDKYTKGLEFEIYNSTAYRVTKYTGTCEDLVIPNKYNGLPVTRIYSNTNNYPITYPTYYTTTSPITSITLGENVTYIGAYAFHGNNNLSVLSLNNSLQTIGTYAFANSGSGQSKLNYVFIPASVTSIGENAFYEYSPTSHSTIFLCEAASMPSGWASDMQNDYHRCIWSANNEIKTSTDFTYIVVDNKAILIRYIGSSLSVIPKKIDGYDIKSIGYAFFNRNSPQNLVIEADLDCIEPSAFNNTSLKSLTINGNVGELKGGCLRGTELTTLIVNNETTVINGLFGGYSGKTSLTTLTLKTMCSESMQGIFGYSGTSQWVTVKNLTIEKGNITNNQLNKCSINKLILGKDVILGNSQIPGETKMVLLESEHFNDNWHENALNGVDSSKVIYGYRGITTSGAFTFATVCIDSEYSASLIAVDTSKLPYDSGNGKSTCEVPTTDPNGYPVTRVKCSALVLNGNNAKSIIIPDTIKYIEAKQVYYTGTQYTTFYIYLKTTKLDSTWASNWNQDPGTNYNTCQVYYSGQWHYMSNGHPAPNS